MADSADKGCNNCLKLLFAFINESLVNNNIYMLHHYTQLRYRLLVRYFFFVYICQTLIGVLSDFSMDKQIATKAWQTYKIKVTSCHPQYKKIK